MRPGHWSGSVFCVPFNELRLGDRKNVPLIKTSATYPSGFVENTWRKKPRSLSHVHVEDGC